MRTTNWHMTRTAASPVAARTPLAGPAIAGNGLKGKAGMGRWLD